MAVETAEVDTAPLVAPPSTETQLEYLVRNTQACVLRPFCFFVSWQGVITLAYKGFPQQLVELKQQLTDFYQALPKENPGSKWPKTSLGALKEGKRLTPEQLTQLNTICREQSGVFQYPGHKRSQAVLVDELSVVTYECRCLERQICNTRLPLKEPVDMSEAAAEEVERVQKIVAEADDPDYWYHASRDGSREGHYKSGALGVTLIHELACFKPGGDQLGWSTQLPGTIHKFRERVEAALPGLYTWFDDSSLHVTVRAII